MKLINDFHFIYKDTRTRKDVWYVFLVAENDEIFNAEYNIGRKKESKKVCLILPSMNQSQI